MPARSSSSYASPPSPVPPSLDGEYAGWGGQQARRSLGDGGVLNPMIKPSSSFLTLRGRNIISKNCHQGPETGPKWPVQNAQSAIRTALLPLITPSVSLGLVEQCGHPAVGEREHRLRPREAYAGRLGHA